MTFGQLLKKGIEYLEDMEIADAKVDAWLLMEFIWDIDRSYYFLHRDDMIIEDKRQEYEYLLEQRGRHIPLQYLTHRAYFMGLSFYVDEHVLIPRMDTEVLVETALKYIYPGAQVLDLCTGSGCILLALLQKRQDCEGVGVDISPEALQVAEKNARRLKVDTEFIQSDLFSGVSGAFDLILSNPPYIPSCVIPDLMEEVREHEPVLALDGREDGLFYYRNIIAEAREYLKPKGRLLFEIGYDQGKAVSDMLSQAGYGQIQVISDLAGQDRVVMGQC
jgi:release factor glutamine methyltransferase